MADTLASGASARKGMRVQVPLAAPYLEKIFFERPCESLMRFTLVPPRTIPVRAQLARLCLCAVSLKRVSPNNNSL